MRSARVRSWNSRLRCASRKVRKGLPRDVPVEHEADQRQNDNDFTYRVMRTGLRIVRDIMGFFEGGRCTHRVRIEDRSRCGKASNWRCTVAR
jgi:hypothetical protein